MHALNLLVLALAIFLPTFILSQILKPEVAAQSTLFLADSELGWRMRPGAREVWGGRSRTRQRPRASWP